MLKKAGLRLRYMRVSLMVVGCGFGIGLANLKFVNLPEAGWFKY